MATVIIFVAVFVLVLIGMFLLHKKTGNFNLMVIVGLLTGIAFGFILYKLAPDATSDTIRWTGLLGSVYVRLLKMMAIPLIFVSITCAIINQKAGAGLGKLTATILAVLLITAAISAVVGGLTAMSFDLSAQGIETGEAQESRGDYLEERAESMGGVDKTILNVIPDNPLWALSGQGPSATLAVVLFACILGLAIRGVGTYSKDQSDFMSKFLNSLNAIVVELVMMILQLTPYGIFSLMVGTVAGSDYESLKSLAKFVVASYVAILIMFIIHGLILGLFGLNPITFYKKALTALTFAFTSRTSAGTLPLTVRSLTEKMGVESGAANLAASLAISIGQNGCGGIYPAMLVIMIAPVVGKEITIGYFITMIIVVTVASIGVAGVGGGATFAAITVLGAMGLPIGIAGVLVAVEPMIDMARTALNVSDGMIAGLVSAKLTDNISMDVYNDKKRDFTDKAAVKSMTE